MGSPLVRERCSARRTLDVWGHWHFLQFFQGWSWLQVGHGRVKLLHLHFTFSKVSPIWLRIYSLSLAFLQVTMLTQQALTFSLLLVTYSRPVPYWPNCPYLLASIIGKLSDLFVLQFFICEGKVRKSYCKKKKKKKLKKGKMLNEQTCLRKHIPGQDRSQMNEEISTSKGNQKYTDKSHWQIESHPRKQDINEHTPRRINGRKFTLPQREIEDKYERSILLDNDGHSNSESADLWREVGR